MADKRINRIRRYYWKNRKKLRAYGRAYHHANKVKEDVCKYGKVHSECNVNTE